MGPKPDAPRYPPETGLPPLAGSDWPRTIWESGLPLALVDATCNRILQVNPAFARERGYEPADLVGLRLQDLRAPEARGRVEQDAKEVDLAGHLVFETIHLRKDGSSFPVLMDVTLVCGPEGSPARRIAYALDISGRREAERALRERDRHSKSLLRIAQGLENAASHQAALEVALGELESILGYRDIWAYRLDRERRVFHSIGAAGPNAGPVLAPEGTACLPVDGDSMLEEIADAHDIVVVEDARTDPRTDKAIVAAIGAVTLVNLPVFFLDGSSGTVGLGTYLPDGPRAPSPSEREFLMAIADQLGAAFDRIGLLEQRRRAERALQESEEKFRSLVETAQELVWRCDAEGRSTYLNPAWEKTHGYRLEQMLGRPFGDFQRPAEAARDRQAFARRLEMGALQGYETTHVAADGTELTLLFNATPLHDARGEVVGAQGTAVDITERKRAEESAARWQHIFSRSELPLAYADHHSARLLAVNRVFARQRGYQPEELVGTTIAGLYAPAELPRVGLLLDQLEAREHLIFESVQRRKDGSEFPVLVDLTLIRDADGRPVSRIAYVQDLSERKRLEEERRALEEQVQRTQKMDSLGSLAGGVAHDMNNVLGAILALATLHERTAAAGSPIHQAMETITKACLRGRTLVQGLLGFARQELPQPRSVDLNEVVREQATLLEHTTLGRVRVLLDLDTAPVRVKGDPSALGHALMNLCVNAVDAMPEGGVLTLRTRILDETEVALEVRDTGRGMPPEVLARATEPFFTTKPQGKGTGLGLSIVYGTVKSHGGRLELQSAPGEGTRVLLRLPSCKEADPGLQAEAAAAAEAASLRVLVVDDDELVLASLGPLLEGLGHEPRLTGSGEEALQAVEDGETFDGVILDLNMPGLGGEATLARLRDLRPGLPVFLSTGRADQHAIDLAARTPAVTLLAKPFSLEELARMLAALPARRR